MVLNLTRLAVVTLGDRLVVAALDRGRLQTFVVDAEDASAALRAELGARKLRPRSVAVGLPRASTAVKPIDLPEVGGDLADMVRFELERHLPFPADDAPFAFVPLPRAADALPVGPGTRRVLIAAADRRVVDSALRLVTEAGLRPVSVTVAAHDLVSLVAIPRRKRVVWVHRAGSDADLLLLSGTIVLSRSVTAADEAIVADEIKRSLAVVRWRNVDAIWVSGDAAAPEGPTTSSLAEFGAPVTAPPFTSSAQRHLETITEEPKGARTLAAAVVMSRRARPLDLIPEALRPRRLTRPQLLTIGSAAAAVLLGLGALLVPGYRDGRRLTAINAEIARVDPEVRAVERLLGDLERKKKLLGTIESVESAAIKPLPVLRELTDLLPTDAWLTLLSLDAKGVELTGQAAAASALIPLLENSPRLERVEFASPVTRGRDKEQFRIVAKWEAVAMRTPQAAAPVTPGAAAVRPTPPAGLAAPGAPAAQSAPALPGALTRETPAATAPGRPPQRSGVPTGEMRTPQVPPAMTMPPIPDMPVVRRTPPAPTSNEP